MSKFLAVATADFGDTGDTGDTGDIWAPLAAVPRTTVNLVAEFLAK
jgi:hypothetical protein